MISSYTSSFFCSYCALLRFALFCFGLLTFASISCFAVDPVTQVETMMGRAAFGKGPLLWFKNQPELNQGSGDSTWGITSGGRLSNRGEDPWHRAQCAFGPGTGQGGAAVAGSGRRELEMLHVERGGMILFIRPGDKLGVGSVLILSRGDWNDAGYFGLRIKRGRFLAISAFDSSKPTLDSKVKEVEAAVLPPLEWSFVAVSWDGNGDSLEFRWWAGPLAAGELTEGQMRVPALKKSAGTIMIGGRRAFEDAARTPVTLTGGLITQLAIYEHALDDERVKDIYLAAHPR